jgi:hypothetical protein
MPIPELRQPNPTTWIHFILACAVPDPEMPDGFCGEFIESEPCKTHGTSASDA